MQALPTHLIAYKRTSEFEQDSIPAGLLRAHSTKAGTWAKIVILEGQLRYRILEPQRTDYLLTPSNFGVIEPQVSHEVAALGCVRFFVEFYH